MHHHLLHTALLIAVASSAAWACIPTKTPEPGIPAGCKTCPAPSPTIDEDPTHAAQMFLSMDKKCNTWTFVCTGAVIEINGEMDLSDKIDGKITTPLECSADQTSWQYKGTPVTIISCIKS
ncbi:hypothetical protein PRIPAC_79118 [Pristionchus pacificus]|uniref:Uncharacterized protein n=1 Tax=Pristionchus pacificus TaxID=54126 RepID=A0A454XRB5_PRIPA|nr:hypothetical protein PRIPAC_79118 [Pristionchus pacificus]|eukprot:PDM78348.1 hypothetical protein PRIPAC_30927 [Pristionchus pacificus]